jgi:hypothetical protein
MEQVKLYKVKVRKIKLDTQITTKNHHDIFAKEMKSLWGTIIMVKRIPNTASWFVQHPAGYNFHISWLKFIKET